MSPLQAQTAKRIPIEISKAEMARIPEDEMAGNPKVSKSTDKHGEKRKSRADSMETATHGEKRKSRADSMETAMPPSQRPRSTSRPSSYSSEEEPLIRVRDGEGWRLKTQAVSLGPTAQKILRDGAWPEVPPGRRDWNEPEAVTLPSPATFKCPPPNWKELSPDNLLWAWEVATACCAS